MSSLKPIMHGWSDPCHIPDKCRQCIHYDPNGHDFPRCTRREDGKFLAEIEYSCFKRKPLPEK